MDQPHSRRMGSRTWPWRGFAGGRFRFRFAIERSAKVKDLHVLERFWHTWHASASPVHGEFIIYSPLCWESGCLASEAIWRRSFEEMLRWSNAAIQIPILKKWALNNSAGIHGSAKRANVFHTHTHTHEMLKLVLSFCGCLTCAPKCLSIFLTCIVGMSMADPPKDVKSIKCIFK